MFAHITVDAAPETAAAEGVKPTEEAAAPAPAPAAEDAAPAADTAPAADAAAPEAPAPTVEAPAGFFLYKHVHTRTSTYTHIQR